MAIVLLIIYETKRYMSLCVTTNDSDADSEEMRRANYMYRRSVGMERCIEYRLVKSNNASLPSGPVSSLEECLQKRSCAAHSYFFTPSLGL